MHDCSAMREGSEQNQWSGGWGLRGWHTTQGLAHQNQACAQHERPKVTALTSNVISRKFLGICMTPESPSSPDTHTQGLEVVMVLLSFLMGIMTTRYGITEGTNRSGPRLVHKTELLLFLDANLEQTHRKTSKINILDLFPWKRM